MGEDATRQIGVKFTLHIGRQACGSGIGIERGEKGFNAIWIRKAKRQAKWYAPPRRCNRGAFSAGLRRRHFIAPRGTPQRARSATAPPLPSPPDHSEALTRRNS